MKTSQTARRFDPVKNRAEMDAWYGPRPEPNWNALLAAVHTQDNRDLRDPEKIGRRLLRNAKRRAAK